MSNGFGVLNECRFVLETGERPGVNTRHLRRKQVSAQLSACGLAARGWEEGAGGALQGSGSPAWLAGTLYTQGWKATLITRVQYNLEGNSAAAAVKES